MRCPGQMHVQLQAFCSNFLLAMHAAPSLLFVLCDVRRACLGGRVAHVAVACMSMSAARACFAVMAMSCYNRQGHSVKLFFDDHDLDCRDDNTGACCTRGDIPAA